MPSLLTAPSASPHHRAGSSKSGGSLVLPDHAAASGGRPDLSRCLRWAGEAVIPACHTSTCWFVHDNEGVVILPLTPHESRKTAIHTGPLLPTGEPGPADRARR